MTKGYSFKIGVRIIGESEADARNELRKLYNIPMHLPDEFLEYIPDDNDNSDSSD